MKKRCVSALLILIMVLLTACNGGGASGNARGIKVPAIGELSQTGYTETLPDSYKKASTLKSKVEKCTYESRDYARDNAVIERTVYVYLPPDYDENDTETRYNIVYLMHGLGGEAGEFFKYPETKNIIDNLIKNGAIPPVILVSPSFYCENSDTEFEGSINDLRYFHLDFENYLMPFIEGKYHTYAEDTTEEALKASRDHRVFGGFSLGSVTTWLEFCYDYDYIRYFIPMSASCWYYGTYEDYQVEKNADFVEKLIKSEGLDERGYFIYHTVGTNDWFGDQSYKFSKELLKRNTFTPEHYVFYEKNGGKHTYSDVQEYLYNALPIILNDILKRDAANRDAAFDRTTSIKDVVNYPSFKDFGRLLFPLDDRYYSGTRLNGISMVKCDEINPDITVEILNTLAKSADAGESVFFDIYSDEEKAQDAEKADTGIFFLRGKENSKTAICVPAGGFTYVSALADAFPKALELSKQGCNVFVLIYRPGLRSGAEDLERALQFIKAHSSELKTDSSDIELWGENAGEEIIIRYNDTKK